MAIKVIDNDLNEIRIEHAGKSIRSWEYRDRAEMKIKMGLAREFAEGWFQAKRESQ